MRKKMERLAKKVIALYPGKLYFTDIFPCGNIEHAHKLKISTSSGHYDYEFEPVKMNFNPNSDNFYDFSIEDFSLENYNPIKPQLKLELGV